MREVHEKQDESHLKELILSAKRGDETSFEEVYTTYYTPIYRYIYSRIKNKDEAEDIAQTVFMKVWSALPNWNPEHTSPLAYFFTIARNTMIDYFRKKSSSEIVSDEVVSIYADRNTDTDKESIDKELGETLKSAIVNLSKEQQEIIDLIYTHDLTYKEISKILGKREDAIRQIHSRALKRLRELYEY